MQIDFPFHLDSRGRSASTDEEAHIRDMIEQLLFTNNGERVNMPEFGSGLLQLIFSPNSPELAAALQFTAQGALQRWLGDLIEVRALEVVALDSALRVSVQYLIRQNNEPRTFEFARTL
jgi:hypothetical protein